MQQQKTQNRQTLHVLDTLRKEADEYMADQLLSLLLFRELTHVFAANLTLRHTPCNAPSFSCSSSRISSYHCPICDLQESRRHIKPNTKDKTQSIVRSFTLTDKSALSNTI